MIFLHQVERMKRSVPDKIECGQVLLPFIVIGILDTVEVIRGNCGTFHLSHTEKINQAKWLDEGLCCVHEVGVITLVVASPPPSFGRGSGHHGRLQTFCIG